MKNERLCSCRRSSGRRTQLSAARESLHEDHDPDIPPPEGPPGRHEARRALTLLEKQRSSAVGRPRGRRHQEDRQSAVAHMLEQLKAPWPPSRPRFKSKGPGLSRRASSRFRPAAANPELPGPHRGQPPQRTEECGAEGDYTPSPRPRNEEMSPQEKEVSDTALNREERKAGRKPRDPRPAFASPEQPLETQPRHVIAAVGHRPGPAHRVGPGGQ